MIRSSGALIIFATATAFGQRDGSASPMQSPAFNPLVVAKQPPALCSPYLYDVSASGGSQAYRRVLFVSEALSAAERGVIEASGSVSKMKDAKSYTQLWAESLSGKEAWASHMLCAAQIMFRYAPDGETDDPESTFAVLLTVAYNQQAHAIERLSSSQKRRISRTSEATPAEEIADAEELHEIEVEQTDSADSIFKIGLLAAAEAEDLSDKKAIRVQKLLLTCSERKKIRDLLSPITTDKESLFGKVARQMLSMWSGKECK